MSAKITLGKIIGTEKIAHISIVKNGLKCNCECVECGEKLIAVNNKNNKREIHFRHEIESDCKGGIETALHLLAKQIVAENNSIRLFDNTFFNYSKSEIEVSLTDYNPDVIIENIELNQKWLIELAVTSFIGNEKLEKIQRDNLNCLEIDLKKVDRKISPNELKDIILNDLEVRSVINQENIRTEKEKSEENYLMYIIGFIALIFGLRKIFRRKKL
ncbi:hypothetical protein [Mangrovimonas spongiae]|uniref:hypothetical protein n=1 Tax=Mangrovimonas spongiae TaxID=2494697 RepID=UPI001F0BB9F3|nr:hypothetical protein [Mangrovimonas spongiae]